jgi:antitoxin (DNA-binding transcriptional repressor) of toxin-antitoxin stability system
MKTATIRELRSHFPRLEALLFEGESITITKRKRVVAIINLLATQRGPTFERVSVALASGFHNACADHGEGFCTFNGLVAALEALRMEGKNPHGSHPLHGSALRQRNGIP